jgi:hypothetical protein
LSCIISAPFFSVGSFHLIEVLWRWKENSLGLDLPIFFVSKEHFNSKSSIRKSKNEFEDDTADSQCDISIKREAAGESK